MQDAIPMMTHLNRYTDIENIRNFPSIFENGEEVEATEKIHGHNCKVGMVEDDDGNLVRVGASMDTNRQEPDDGNDSPYWHAWKIPGVTDLIRHVLSTSGARQVLLFGEAYGGSLQSFHYGIHNGFEFVAFDLLVGGKYVDPDKFKSLCRKYNVPTVPVLYRGPYSLDKIREAAEGKTTFKDKHIKEGVIVKPIKERTNSKIGRVVLKYLSDKYLFGKHSDQKDV